MKRTLILFLFAILFVCGMGKTVYADELTNMSDTTQTTGVSWPETAERPEEELYPEKMQIHDKAIIVGDKAYVFALVDYTGGESGVSCLYEEDGNVVECISWSVSSVGCYQGVKFEIEAFSGSKEIMIAKYHRDETSGLQVYDVGKTATITAEEWNGSMFRVTANTLADMHNTKHDTMFCLPAEANTSDLEINVYEDDEPVAWVNCYSTYETTTIYLGSLMNYDMEYYVYSDTSVFGGRCYINWIKAPEANEQYTIKATAAGKEYNMGIIDSKDMNQIVSVFCNPINSVASYTPVVRINSWGYDKEKLEVEIIDIETSEVLASSAGGGFLRESGISSYHRLVTEKSPEELQNCRIVIKYAGEEIENLSAYTGTYSAYIGEMYYNHEQNIIVGMTQGIADGTVIDAKIGSEYTAQGIVEDSKVFMSVMKDGIETQLPPGKYKISNTYASGNAVSRYGSPLVVMGNTDTNNSVLFKVMRDYFTTDEGICVNAVVGKEAFSETEGDFSAKLYKKNTQIGSTLTLEAKDTMEDGEDCWLLSGNFQNIDAGNYTCKVYKGTKLIKSYSVYLGEAGKLYAIASSVPTLEDGFGVKVDVSAWDRNAFEWNEELLSVKVTDYWGNDIGVTAVQYEEGFVDGCAEYYFCNVPKRYLFLKVAILYDGQLLYDITDIAADEVLEDSYTYENDYFYMFEESAYSENGIYQTNSIYVQKDAYAKVVEHSTMDVLTTWEFFGGQWNRLTEDMLEGLKADSGAVMYDIYLCSKDGTSYDSCKGVYIGAYREPEEVVENGISRAEDGKYYLYVDGEINTAYTGLYYWAEKDEWVMIVSGLLDTSYTALICYNDIWWYVEKGYVNFDFTGLVTLGDTQWYVANGQIDFTYQGLLCYLDEWYYVVNGAVDKNYNGLAFVNDAWWYVVSGKIDFTFTGLAFVNEKWWYVNGGRIDFAYHGICEFNGETYYIQNGEINYAASGLVCVNPDWYFVENGKVRRDYSGMLFVNDAWWYVVRGQIDFDFSGLFLFASDWWFVSQGKIVLGYIGLVYYNDQWWYLENGVVNFIYNGFAYVNDIWWWVVNGNIDFKHNGIHEFGGIWWYVEGAQIDFTYNGTVTGPDGNTYEVVNGEVRGYTRD